MSATTSATTGRRYGLKRVCRTWERSRSALYARWARVRRQERSDGPGRRRPTPALSDAQLLAAIRRGSEQDDLDRTAVLKDPIESLVEAPAVRLAVATVPGGLRHGRPSPSPASHSNRAAPGRRVPRSLRG